MPEEPEDYVHRIGRTGRAGSTGTSISFACEDDAFLLEPIEKLLDMKLACTMPEEKLLQEVPAKPKRAPRRPKADKPSEQSKQQSSVEQSEQEVAPVDQSVVRED